MKGHISPRSIILIRKSSAYRSENGGVLPLAAMVIFIALLVGSGIGFLMSLGAAREQTRGAARLVALGAIEHYFATSCPQGTSIDNCHNLKFAAAMSRASELTAKNQSVFGPLVIGNGQGGENGLLVPMVHYESKPPTSDPCNGSYPCTLNRQAGQATNAVSFSGIAHNSLLQNIGGLFSTWAVGDIPFQTTATAAAMHTCFAVDISPSTAEMTHLAFSSMDPETKETLPQSFVGFPLVTKNGAPSKNSTNDSVFGQIPSDLEIAPDFVNVWNALGTSQGSRSKYTNPARHFQDDYASVRTVDPTQDGYNKYPTELRKYHPAPGDGGMIYSGDDGEINYMVDLYRTKEYAGAQPYTSILLGVKHTLELMQGRHIAGDKACLIFYDETITWSRAFSLTDDLQYLISIIDDSLIDPDKIQTALSDYNSKHDPMMMPAWMHLGIFPKVGFTNTMLAISEAQRQLSTEGGLFPEGVPSSSSASNAIIHFGDGLPNCTTGSGGTCDDTYPVYRGAMNQIKNYAETTLYPSRTVLHMVMEGEQTGPHTIEIHDNGGQTKKGEKSQTCLTEEQARQRGVETVLGQSFATENHAAFAFSQRHTQPFYQANEDWYKIVRLTGGVFGPIRPTPDGCVPRSPCSSATNERLLVDPECRSIDEQVDGYLGHIFESSHTFKIIQSN